MPTTVHIPPALLEAADKRATALGISRNRLIVRALEREVLDPSTWSPGFLDELRRVEAGVTEAVDELIVSVRSRRRSKAAPRL